MAIAVPTRLWLGGVISHSRDKNLIRALAAKVKACALFAPLLLVSDGFSSYVSAWKKAFRTPLWTAKQGRPRLLAWPTVVIGQVIKIKEKGSSGPVTGVEQRLVQGTSEQLAPLLPEGQVLNTAYIERLNATFRSRLCSLVRRGRALARQSQRLHLGMFLVGTVYNFCTAHQSLEGKTPATASGIADHCWSVEAVLDYKVAPPPFVPPKRRGRPPKCKKSKLGDECSMPVPSPRPALASANA